MNAYSTITGLRARLVKLSRKIVAVYITGPLSVVKNQVPSLTKYPHLQMEIKPIHRIMRLKRDEFTNNEALYKW